jgi:heptosyltransferase-2
MSRARPRLADFSRIAVIQTAYLGDVALTLPLMEALRQLHPRSQRMLVVTPAAAALAACAAAVDEVVSYDKHGRDAGVAGLRRCAQRLREWGVELVLVPHRSLRSALLALLARPRFAVGSSRTAFPWAYDVRVPYPWHVHEVERNLALLSPFADADCAGVPVVTLRPLDWAEQRLNQRLQSVGIGAAEPLVVLAPGSAWATKRWSPQRYAELARRLRAEGYAVVVTGSAAEAELCRAVAEAGGVPSLAGQLEIPEFLVLVRRARCVVCNDSAPIHLAELVGTPVVALFGPTIPQFGFAPRLPQSCVVERSLPCRPCSVHGSTRCPVRTHACLEGIPAEEVWQHVRALLR